MMFKFMDGGAALASWRLIDGVRDVSWSEAWLAIVKGKDEYAPESVDQIETSTRLPDFVDVHLQHPDKVKKGEPRALISAEPYWERNAVRRLQEGKERAIPILIVQLTHTNGDVRTLAVHYGYVLNDEGNTIERLNTSSNVA